MGINVIIVFILVIDDMSAKNGRSTRMKGLINNSLTMDLKSCIGEDNSHSRFVVKGGMARLVSPSEEAGVNHDSDEGMGMFGPDELTDYYTEVFTLHREYLYSLPTTINNDSRMIDSGCGLHLTGNRKWLVDCSSTVYPVK